MCKIVETTMSMHVSDYSKTQKSMIIFESQEMCEKAVKNCYFQ